jgi:hypothetical protein
LREVDEKKSPFTIDSIYDKLTAGKSEKVGILKETGIDRIGVAAAYEEFTGLRFGKYFTVGQRVEIYQEARPIDSYILDAQAIRYLGRNGLELDWDKAVEYRSQIVPLFTRAYGTQLTIDNPDMPGPQIRLTLDYRDLYREYYPKWEDLGVARWLQDEIMLIDSGLINGIDWRYTINLGYRYSTINQTDISNTPTKAGYENRHTYIVNLALAPSERLEWFGQFEYYKSKRPRSTFTYSPDHYLWRTELRTKSRDLKTSVIPSFSYSKDLYYPFRNQFEKYELGMRVGHEFTEKISGTTQFKYVLALRNEPDNRAPTYVKLNHVEDYAETIASENRLSVNFWNDFYAQAGLDFEAGINMSAFDNWGTFLGLEYYKPGVLRANIGWDTNVYYNIDDFLSSIGFRTYVFM